MKSKNLLLFTFFTLAAEFSFFFAMDVSFSAIADFDYSFIHYWPVNRWCILAFWIACILTSIVSFKTTGWVIKKQPGKKTIGWFLLFFIAIEIMAVAAYDVHFSQQLSLAKSLLFHLPATRWVYSCIAFPCISFLCLFAFLFKKVMTEEKREDNEPSQTEANATK